MLYVRFYQIGLLSELTPGEIGVESDNRAFG